VEPTRYTNPSLSTAASPHLSIPHMPLSAREQKRKTNEIVHANAPQPLSEPRHRPYLLKMLQQELGTCVLADTLDWDGERPSPSLHFPSRAARGGISEKRI